MRFTGRSAKKKLKAPEAMKATAGHGHAQVTTPQLPWCNTASLRTESTASEGSGVKAIVNLQDPAHGSSGIADLERTVSGIVRRELDAQLMPNVRLVLNQILSDGSVVMTLVQNPQPASTASTATRRQQASAESHEEALMRCRLAESEERVKKLQEEVETLRPQQYGFRSGAFEEGGPTPTLLQDALAAVQNAVKTCAVKMREYIKSSAGRLRRSRASLEALLCDSVFHGFERASMAEIRGHEAPIFRRPTKALKARLFREFLFYKHQSAEELLNSRATEFGTFYVSKHDNFKAKLAPAVWIWNSSANGSSCGCSSIAPDHFFARLAMSVWLLHKLAFSFEPTAEIFRVPEGCTYDSEFMEDLELEQDNDADANTRLVASMVVPGFTVRSFVFKAKVYLHQVTDTTECP